MDTVYLMKHTFECLLWLLKWSIILGEIEGSSWQNFMVIRNTYDLFSLDELLMSLRSAQEENCVDEIMNGNVE